MVRFRSLLVGLVLVVTLYGGAVPRAPYEEANVAGSILAIHGRLGMLSRVDHLEKHEVQAHLEVRSGRLYVAIGGYQDNYNDLAPDTSPCQCGNGNNSYTAGQWRLGFVIADPWGKLVMPCFGADILGAAVSDVAGIWPTMRNCAAGVEVRSGPVSFHVGLKHVGPIPEMAGNADRPPKHVTFLVAGMGVRLNLLRTRRYLLFFNWPPNPRTITIPPERTSGNGGGGGE